MFNAGKITDMAKKARESTNATTGDTTVVNNPFGFINDAFADYANPNSNPVNVATDAMNTGIQAINAGNAPATPTASAPATPTATPTTPTAPETPAASAPTTPTAPPPAVIPSTVQPQEQIDTSAIVGRMSAKAGAQASAAAQAAGLNPALAAMQGASASANKYTDAFFDQQKLRQAELAQKQQAEQFAITAGQTEKQISNDMTKFYENMGLTREQMAQAQSQFEITAGMTQEQINNQAQQFADQLGLTREQWEEAKKQWEIQNVKDDARYQDEKDAKFWRDVVGTGVGILDAFIPG